MRKFLTVLLFFFMGHQALAANPVAGFVGSFRTSRCALSPADQLVITLEGALVLTFKDGVKELQHLVNTDGPLEGSKIVVAFAERSIRNTLLVPTGNRGLQPQQVQTLTHSPAADRVLLRRSIPGQPMIECLFLRNR